MPSRWSKMRIEKALVGKWNLKEGLYTPFTRYPIERMGAEDKPHPKVWAEKDERFLLENWGKIPRQELAQRLGITPKAVRKKYARLKHSPIWGTDLAKNGQNHPTDGKTAQIKAF